jgi:hypothetical protein
LRGSGCQRTSVGSPHFNPAPKTNLSDETTTFEYSGDSGETSRQGGSLLEAGVMLVVGCGALLECEQPTKIARLTPKLVIKASVLMTPNEKS